VALPPYLPTPSPLPDKTIVKMENNIITEKLVAALVEITSENIVEFDDQYIDIFKTLAIRNQCYYIAALLRDEQKRRLEKQEQNG